MSGLNFQVECKFSLEVKRSAQNWEHRSETLAQNAILFSDRKVRSNPDWTVVTTQGTDKFLFENSSPHKLRLPWNFQSGWLLNQGPININLKTRSAFIWGMVLMPEQLTENLQLQMKIKYFRVSSDYVNPSKPL